MSNGNGKGYTCSTCIYASHYSHPSLGGVHEIDGRVRECRKTRVPVMVNKEYWCGEGKWRTPDCQLILFDNLPDAPPVLPTVVTDTPEDIKFV